MHRLAVSPVTESTNSDPRPVSAPSMPAFVPSTDPANPAANGIGAASSSSPLRARSGRFPGGQRLPGCGPRSRTVPRPPHRPTAAARRTRKTTARSRARRATQAGPAQRDTACRPAWPRTRLLRLRCRLPRHSVQRLMYSQSWTHNTLIHGVWVVYQLVGK